MLIFRKSAFHIEFYVYLNEIFITYNIKFYVVVTVIDTNTSYNLY